MKKFFQCLLVLAFMGTNMAFAEPVISLTDSAEHVAISTEAGTLTLTPEVLSLIDPNAILTTGIFAGILSLGAIFLFIPVLLAIFLTVVGWKIYSKAGYPGWHSIVPILNIITFVRFTGTGLLMGGSVLLLFVPMAVPDLASIIPLISFILSFVMVYKMAKSFGKGIGFTFGLFFLGLIFAPILAFNKEITYVGPGGKTL